MFATSKLRLRQSVGIVANGNLVEFFKSNTRDNLVLKMQSHGVIEFLQHFNGINSIHDIHSKHTNLNIADIISIANTLKNNYILIENNSEYPTTQKNENYRLINILEEYFHSTSDVLKSINNIKNSTVMIIGLGAVGSYIALYLSKIGVTSFILVDADNVDVSNLHRQAFFESDVGLPKAIQLETRIKEINKNANVKIIQRMLSSDFFNDKKPSERPNLIINCADNPSVDFTSAIVSEFAMQHRIPHIVGGGYNLHLTLIGQTIIPFETACFKCFEIALEKINGADFNALKRLDRSNRKLGSFSPLSGIAASLAALDAFKVLAGANAFLQQSNKRVEFNVNNRKFNIIDIPRNPNCQWCCTSF
jgi:molybdopterin/thiamine biosynthesis adenylyltransferase